MVGDFSILNLENETNEVNNDIRTILCTGN